MKFLIAALILPLFLNACSIRPQKPSFKNSRGATPGEGPASPNTPGTPGTPGKPQYPAFVDSNDPLDSYLSIGPYLQKEFDAADSANKTVKVYLQVRQENSVEKNFSELKNSIGKLHASVTPALEAAQKKGDTTVEFETEVGALKGIVPTINKAVSGIEVSLPSVK